MADPNGAAVWLQPLLETGDPVVGIGFAKGSNTFGQGPTPDGTQVADGYYHPEDEVFMPWFMRLNPSSSQAHPGRHHRPVHPDGQSQPLLRFQGACHRLLTNSPRVRLVSIPADKPNRLDLPLSAA